MPKKVNLYKWHRMKKKLISSVISILCCLAVMAVGVYASTTAQFNVTVSNDIDIQIAVVDGVLSAKRRGGVYSGTIESKYGSAGAIASDFVLGEYKENYQNDSDRTAEGKDDFWYKDFVPLYDQSTTMDSGGVVLGVGGNLARIQGEKLDINVYQNEIEYIFRYEVEQNNSFPTYISLGDIAESVGGVGLFAEYQNNSDINAGLGGEGKIQNYITLKYQYVTGSSALEEPTREEWETKTDEMANGGKIENFPVAYGKENLNATVSVGGNDGAPTVIYIRCYLKYDTEIKGNENYDPSVSGSVGVNNGMISESLSGRATFHKKWMFELTFSNADKSQPEAS